jgi:hypothetical protein
MGACYHYNPRHGQPISVPRLWKCPHRRSVTSEEGKPESGLLLFMSDGERRALFEIQINLFQSSESKFVNVVSFRRLNYERRILGDRSVDT